MQSCEVSIVVLSSQLGLICLRKSSNHLLYLMLGQLRLLFVHDFVPGLPFTLWIWEGSQAMHMGSNGLVRLIVSKNLL